MLMILSMWFIIFWRQIDHQQINAGKPDFFKWIPWRWLYHNDKFYLVNVQKNVCHQHESNFSLTLENNVIQVLFHFFPCNLTWKFCTAHCIISWAIAAISWQIAAFSSSSMFILVTNTFPLRYSQKSGKWAGHGKSLCKEMTWPGNVSLLTSMEAICYMDSHSILLMEQLYNFLAILATLCVLIPCLCTSGKRKVCNVCRSNCYCMSTLFKEVWAYHTKVYHTTPHCNAFTAKWCSWSCYRLHSDQ